VTTNMYRGAVLLGTIATLAGCSTQMATAMVSNSPDAIERLQVASAGHTGCRPENNSISVVWMKPDGSGVWQATCQGKVYLCSVVSSPGSNAQDISCAPAVQ
jgi:hypothetical protein